MEPVPVLMVVYNRLEYTKKAVESVLKNPGIPVSLTIWDNASTEEGMKEWLLSLKCGRVNEHASIDDVCFSMKNQGLAVPMNYFFKAHARFPFVAKVDNDTVLPDNWLRDLMDVMTETKYKGTRLGAVSGTCLRPYGLTGEQWLATMPWESFHGHRIHYNSYPLGTGVLINMDMIRERGQLFEKFPRSIGSGPDDPCLISGWTAYARSAYESKAWQFLLYTKVPVNLLNIRNNYLDSAGTPVHELSHDYPEYEAEINRVRDLGNAWWESVCGMAGVERFVQECGGLEPLPVDGPLISPDQYHRTYVDPQYAHPTPVTLTEAKNIDERSTPEFWQARIAEHGTTASTFLTTPQARINEFTDRHEEILAKHLDGYEEVLDVGVGWGRFSKTIDMYSHSYVGVDFMPELIAKARESLPGLRFEVMDARALEFPDASFDVVLSVTGLSSFAGIFEEVLREFHRVLRPGGRIIFLEEHFARIDWKLENE